MVLCHTFSCPKLLWAWKEETCQWSPLPRPPIQGAPTYLQVYDPLQGNDKWSGWFYSSDLFCIRIKSKCFQRSITFLRGTQLRIMPNPNLCLCPKHALIVRSMAMVIQGVRVTRPMWWNAWLNPSIEHSLTHLPCLWMLMFNFPPKLFESNSHVWSGATSWSCFMKQTGMTRSCASSGLHKGTPPRGWVGIEIRPMLLLPSQVPMGLYLPRGTPFPNVQKFFFLVKQRPYAIQHTIIPHYELYPQQMAYLLLPQCPHLSNGDNALLCVLCLEIVIVRSRLHSLETRSSRKVKFILDFRHYFLTLSQESAT